MRRFKLGHKFYLVQLQVSFWIFNQCDYVVGTHYDEQQPQLMAKVTGHWQ